MSAKGVPGGKRKYDWGALFSKKKFTLEYGVDFKITTKAMIQQIKNTASARGVLIEIEVVEPEIYNSENLKIKVKVL